MIALAGGSASVADYKPRSCAYVKCGKKFTPLRFDHIYCTHTCGKKANQVRCTRRRRKGLSGYAHYCRNPACHKPFESKRRHARYCSEACGKQTRRKRIKEVRGTWSREERICPICRAPFEPEKVNQLYCGKDCKHSAKYDAALKRRKKRRSRRRASPALEARRLRVLKATQLADMTGEKVTQVLSRLVVSEVKTTEAAPWPDSVPAPAPRQNHHGLPAGMAAFLRPHALTQGS